MRGRDGGLRRRGRALPAAVAAAVALTLAADAWVIITGRADGGGHERPRGDLVSVARAGAPPVPAVAPLTRRYTPHLLVAGSTPLPARAVERARRLKGVTGLTVVDAARAQVGGHRVGLLGVDPSSFRAFAPEATAESDQLWRTVASGGLALSFSLGQDGAFPLGTVVRAGSSTHPGQVRVGAYASMGIGSVDAVVSHAQARALGLPEGNALLLSAPKTDVRKLGKRLKRILPRGTKIAALSAASSPAKAVKPKNAPRFTGRPDGTLPPRTPITGNLMTPTMRTALLEINGMFGPFPTIGCYRSTGDPQDHGDGRACDFMENTAGRMPSAQAQRHGDEVAAYAVANARRLGVSYVIWKQHIWNVRGGGWRPMADRGSITQNHYDHVHISVLR
ncbi:hypothetical protein [Actinomadura opuntiae]|uniref:hypothetical protein n=1 Tax=Actinomadura sp. OS1-43 TaxID=604315 RepID=UPI00255B3C23|nr:hypothetical protein [Actinomadura sp. OS1-43]MDL4821441.1 hypothetical protein [Actinomadura sp. OS1-43]